jgi:RES domain-containing protein
VRLFRVTREREREAAFDGIGSSLYPGRWNERGKRVVYVTSRIPLGILEITVQTSGEPLDMYLAYPLDVPDASIERCDRSRLTAAWRSAGPGRAECRALGETWRMHGAVVGLVVPSAVLPEAYEFDDVNVVLNPLHPDFRSITIEDPISLDLDTRLKGLVSAFAPAGDTYATAKLASRTRRRKRRS